MDYHEMLFSLCQAFVHSLELEDDIPTAAEKLLSRDVETVIGGLSELAIRIAINANSPNKRSAIPALEEVVLAKSRPDNRVDAHRVEVEVFSGLIQPILKIISESIYDDDFDEDMILSILGI